MNAVPSALLAASTAPEALLSALTPNDPLLALAALAVGLALATFVTEDLTCIAAGVLVANDRMPFWLATLACYVGIWVGDLGLVAVGRGLGRSLLHRPPFRWLVTPEAVERSARWFARRGARVVFVSRFVPGSRLTLFLAAGILRAPIAPIAAALAVAGALWTPLLVGLAAATHGAIERWFTEWSRYALPAVAAAALVVLLISKLLIPALTWRGRRLLYGKFRRATEWEFWPLWLFQLPVLLNWLRLALRYRHSTLFTAANPGIPAGGFVLESKSEILGRIGLSGVVPRFVKLELPVAPDERRAIALAAFDAGGFDFPVVGKPDVGERGEGVTILRDRDQLARWAARAAAESILQEYAAGEEFGVFYVRRPGRDEGEIFSITGKEFPEVTGDGRSSLEELILAHARAVAMAPTYFARNSERLDWVPATGERVRLVEIGNHCRGTVFRDARSLTTPELARAIDEIAKSFPGFWFGRFDLRVPSREALRAGTGIRVLELNGVTSEATHIYEPGASLLAAYRTLFEQWRLCFEIGAANAAAGARPTPLGELFALVQARRHEKQRSALASDRGAEPSANG